MPSRRHSTAEELADRILQVAVIHPECATGQADDATELRSLAKPGMVPFTSLLATFESARARASLCAALAKTEQNFADDGLDLGLPVRGGGAAAGLRTLSDGVIARVLIARPVPVVTSPIVLMTEGS